MFFVKKIKAFLLCSVIDGDLFAHIGSGVSSISVKGNSFSSDCFSLLNFDFFYYLFMFWVFGFVYNNINNYMLMHLQLWKGALMDCFTCYI